MRGVLWGRPKWLWAIDAVLVLVFLVILVVTDQQSTRVIAGAITALRVAAALLQIGRWRTRQREPADEDA